MCHAAGLLQWPHEAVREPRPSHAAGEHAQATTVTVQTMTTAHS